MAREPVCFACGCPTGPLPRLNRLPDGRVCPTCRDRLLDALPAALPTPSAAGAERVEEEWLEPHAGEPDDDFLEGA